MDTCRNLYRLGTSALLLRASLALQYTTVAGAAIPPHPHLYTQNATIFPNITGNGSGQTGNRSGEGADEATGLVPPNQDLACALFVFIMYVIVLGSMCALGLVGNTISFLVLQWERRSHVATFLLRVLALVDNFYLLTTGLASITTSLCLFLGYQNNAVQPYLMVIVWPLVYIAQMATVWMTVLIAFNRYIAICKPFQAPNICTMTKTRLQLIILGIFIVVYNMPRFFEYKISTYYDPELNATVKFGTERDLKLNQWYILIYENILYCLFVFLGPLVILIVFNTCLIRELMMARQRMIKRHLPISGEDEENNLTLVMVIIILIFVLCQSPAFINQVLYFLKIEYACGNWYFYYYQISNIVASLNSCLNFFVYCAFRKQFRQRLVAFCRCGNKGEPLNVYKSYNGGTTTTYVSDSKPDGVGAHKDHSNGIIL